MSRESFASFSGNDRFDVIARLGSGGMGVVYEAYDRQRREKVALKTLQKEEPGALLRLKNEFRALQDLQHPNLVNLGELFHEAGTWFFSMDLIDGVDLIAHVRAGPRVDGERPYDDIRLRACLAQLAEGLEALHIAGRIHRDIKPANILVEEGGRVILLDFGLVTHADPGQKSAEHFFPVGTIDYMSPEQAASRELTPAADLYSVGVLLYEALTGQLPFDGSATKVLLDKQLNTPKRPSEVAEGVPGDLDDLCVALLERDPARRPSARDLLAAFGAHRDHAPHALPGVIAAPDSLFVGRQRELELIERAFSAVVQGKPASLLVHGLSGLGKTELLRAFVRKALVEEPNTIVLHGRCFERESVPYKAFDGVVDSLCQLLQRRSAKRMAGLVPHNAFLLLRMFPVLGRVEVFRDAPPTRFELSDLQEARSLAFGALRELFRRLADQHLVIITIDDLQWADEDSKRLLRALMQPPRAPRALLLTAMRTPGNPKKADQALAEMLEAFPERPDVIALEPLSPEESRELAHALAMNAPENERQATNRLEQVALETEGHPLFIHELVQHARILEQRKKVSGNSGMARLDDALWDRIHHLDDAARSMVEVVAVAGNPVSQAVVAGAAEFGEAEMFRLAGRLRAECLLRTSGPRVQDTIEAYHDRVREAVLARLSPDVIRAWHERLAETMLAAEVAEPEQLAIHLESAGRLAEAAKYAAQAAERATRTLAFRRASELYRGAVANWPTPQDAEQTEELRRLRVAWGEALGNAGRGPEAADAYQAAIEDAPAEDAIELKRRVAEQLLRSGHVERGLTAAQEVLRSLGMKSPRSPFGCLVSLLWQRVRLRVRGLGFDVRRDEEIPAGALLQADVCNAMSQGLALADTVRGSYFSTRFVRSALDLGERSRVIRALWMEVNYAASTGLPAKYLARLHAAIESLIEEHDPLSRAYVSSALAFAAFMAGRWPEALERLEFADEVFTSRGGNVWERTTFRFFILWSLYYLGELRDLTRRIPPLHADAVERGDQYAVVGMLLGLANSVHLNALGPSDTRRLIRRTMQSWTNERYYLRNYYALLAESQVDLFEGDGAKALSRVREQWPGLKHSKLLMVPSVRIEASQLRARASIATAETAAPSQRSALLREAQQHVRRLSRERAGWGIALAQPLRAAVAMQKQSPEQAIAHLRNAISLFDEADMKLFAAATRRHLGVVLGGDEGRELRQRAERFMKSQRIKDPERMSAMLIPGFTSSP